MKLPKENIVVTFIKRAVTFALVCFAWIFFRGNSLSDCGILISKIFKDWSACGAALEKIGFDMPALISVMFMILILALARYISIPKNDNGTLLTKMKISQTVVYVYLVVAVAVAWFALVSGGGSSSFIYFQF